MAGKQRFAVGDLVRICGCTQRHRGVPGVGAQTAPSAADVIIGSWTREFWKRVFDFWIEEFHIDGYRIDLSKGLTQTDSGSDVGAWNQYDQSRVDILFDYANDIWGNHPGTYLILEHLGNNDEETALANGGFMIWGKMTSEYTQAVMGYDGDINYGSWQNRGYQWPNLLTYAESHDEERMAYELTTYGNAYNGYDSKEEATAMDRLAMAHAFLLAIPGIVK